MTRILSVFNLLKRLGFALLLLGVFALAQAQPYEPVILYDMIGDTNQRIGEKILEPLGDQDGDGYSDFLVNVSVLDGHLRIVYGGAQPPYRTLDFAHLDMDTSSRTYLWGSYRENTGRSVLADYTGDGITDIMVDLVDYHARYQSDAYLFIGGGGPEEFDTVWEWRSEYSEASHFVTGLGDFDGNGTPDFTRSGGGWSETFLWYFDWLRSNPPEEPTWAIDRDGPGNNGNFTRCQGVGDITGDGWPDFMHFVYYPDWSRHYEIWFGGPEADSIPDFEFIQDTLQYAAFAHGILGDLNGDGIADLGSYINDIIAPQTGPAIFWGGLPLNLTQPDVMLEHYSGEQITPSGAQCVGDINDDGYDDIGFRETDGRSCYLFLGGNPMDSLWSFYLPEGEFDGFRTLLVRGIGDFNSDGIHDWMISGTGSTSEDFSRGRVVVFAGDRNWGVPVTNEQPKIPKEFELSVFPNPFNSTTTLRMDLPLGTRNVKLTVTNVLGQTVEQREIEVLAPRVDIQLSLDNWPSGIYFAQAQAMNKTQTTKLVLLK